MKTSTFLVLYVLVISQLLGAFALAPGMNPSLDELEKGPDGTYSYHYTGYDNMAGRTTLSYKARPVDNLVRLGDHAEVQVVDCTDSYIILKTTDDRFMRSLEPGAIVSDHFRCSDDLPLMHKVSQLGVLGRSSEGVTIAADRVDFNQAFESLQLTFHTDNVMGLLHSQYEAMSDEEEDEIVFDTSDDLDQQTHGRHLSWSLGKALKSAAKTFGKAASAVTKAVGKAANAVSNVISSILPSFTVKGSKSVPLLQWNYNPAMRSAAKNPYRLASSGSSYLDCRNCFFDSSAGLDVVLEWSLPAKLRLEVIGSVNARANFDLYLQASGSASGRYSKPNLLTLRPVRNLVVFVVVAVPITLDVDVTLGLTASYGASATSVISSGMDFDMTLRGGAEFKFPSPSISPKRYSPKFTKRQHPTTRTLSANANARLQLDVTASFTLAKLARAAVKSSPYVQFTASKGSPCLISASLDVGIDNSASLAVGIYLKPLPKIEKSLSFSLPGVGPVNINRWCWKTGSGKRSLLEPPTPESSFYDALQYFIHREEERAVTFSAEEGPILALPAGYDLDRGRDRKIPDHIGIPSIASQTTISDAGEIVLTTFEGSTSLYDPLNNIIRSDSPSTCSCATVDAGVVDMASTVNIDTCANTALLQENLCDVTMNSTRVQVISVRFQQEGLWEVSLSNPHAKVSVYRGDCCGVYAGCMNDGGANFTVTDDTVTYTLMISIDALSGCGTTSVHFRMNRVLELYVDANEAYGADLPTHGDYDKCFRTLQYALDQAGERFDPDSMVGVIIYLWPNWPHSPAYTPTSTSGFVIPSSLDGFPVRITSLNGERITAPDILELWYRLTCNNIPESLCLPSSQFSALTFGTAFDTEVKCPCPGGALTCNEKDRLECSIFEGEPSENQPLLELQGLWLTDSEHALVFNNFSASIVNAFFYVNSGKVTSSDITVSGASSVVEATGCVFYYSNSKAKGGSITVEEGGTLVLQACLFQGVHADNVEGGAIVVKAGVAQVIATRFYRASSRFGGAIALLHPDAIAFVSSCEFEECRAITNGGAIAVEAGTLAMETSTVLSSLAWDGGGALAAFGPDSLAFVHQCTFETNSAPQVMALAGADVTMNSSRVLAGGDVTSSLGGLEMVSLTHIASGEMPPGNLLCANSTLNFTTSIVQSAQLDHGESLENVRCDGCDSSCTTCGVCDKCSVCTQSGCDATPMLMQCRLLLGDGAICDANSGLCVAPQSWWSQTLFNTAVPGIAYMAITFVVGMLLSTLVAVVCFRLSGRRKSRGKQYSADADNRTYSMPMSNVPAPVPVVVHTNPLHNLNQ